MTDKTTAKVGDVVAWDEVPSGAMVKCEYAVGSGFAGDIDYAMRIGDEGYWPKIEEDDWQEFDAQWGWVGVPKDICSIVIVALDLTGNETAEELRALALAFEREHPAK